MSDTGARSGSPYRGGDGSAPAAEAHENGIVDELIQQFADPLAFYRELVQNSIDAGSTRIAITLGWDPDPAGAGESDPPGVARISVRDDGCGMSREVLENQLTVLFRSGKEGQEDKIGKFGVGFVSVLALKPEQVLVRTSDGGGELWTLALKSDQTYELFQAQGGGTSGTSVTLDVRTPRSALSDLVKGSERALVTWCRHAELPIRFVATLPDGAPMREVRIDRPLGLDALAQVRVTSGPTTVVAGVPVKGGSYLGFFNRGLLLHETRKDLFGAVHVKIQDKNLEHTLSRDNVRRDEHYDRAMKLATKAVDRRLTAEVRERLDEVAAGRREQPALDSLLLGALRAGLDVDFEKLRLPLLEPIGERAAERVDRLARHAAYVASTSSPMTRALARRDVPVIDLGVAADGATYVAVLERLLRRRPAQPETELTLASPVQESGADGVLLDRAAALLADCARRPSAIRLARIEGRKRGALVVAGAMSNEPVALTDDEANEDVFRLLMRAPMLVNADHPLVDAARLAALERPAFAAALLVRGILLLRGRLEEDVDDAWLERAITGLGE